MIVWLLRNGVRSRDTQMKLGGGVRFNFHPATNINRNDKYDASLSFDLAPVKHSRFWRPDLVSRWPFPETKDERVVYI